MADKTLELNLRELKTLASYAHWISALRGYQDEFLGKNYPGWQWNQIVPELIRNGVLAVNSSEENQQYLAYGLSISVAIENVKISISEKGIKVTIKKSKSTTRVGG